MTDLGQMDMAVVHDVAFERGRGMQEDAAPAPHRV